MVNATVGSTAASSSSSSDRDDQFGQQPPDGAGEPRAGQRLRDVRRDDVLHAAPTLLARREPADVHLEHQPRVRRPHQLLRQRRRAVLQVRRPRRAVARQAARRTKVGVLAYGVAAAVDGLRRRASRASFEKYPTAKVVFDDKSLGVRAADLGAAGHADEGRRACSSSCTCIDLQRVVHARQGDAEAGPERGAVAAEGYDQDFIAKNARVLEGSYRRPAVPGVRAAAADPGDQEALRVVRARSASTVDELTRGRLDQSPTEFVHGLEGCRARVLAGRRSSTRSTRSRTTPPTGSSSRSTGRSSTHRSRSTHPEARGRQGVRATS